MDKNKAISIIGGLAFVILEAVSTNANLQAQQQDSDKMKKCVESVNGVLDIVSKNPEMDPNQIKVAVESDEEAVCVARYLLKKTDRKYTIIKGLDGIYRVIKDIDRYT